MYLLKPCPRIASCQNNYVRCLCPRVRWAEPNAGKHTLNPISEKQPSLTFCCAVNDQAWGWTEVLHPAPYQWVSDKWQYILVFTSPKIGKKKQYVVGAYPTMINDKKIVVWDGFLSPHSLHYTNQSCCILSAICALSFCWETRTSDPVCLTLWGPWKNISCLKLRESERDRGSQRGRKKMTLLSV